MLVALRSTAIDAADEDQLSADFAAHRPEALERAYRAYGSLLYSTARRVLGNDADAADCVHDALVRIWERGAAFRPERGNVRAWLVVCVRNEALSRRRAAFRHGEIEESVAATEPREYELPMSDYLESARLRNAIAALPAEQRTALQLAYYRQLTHVQIAGRVGAPLGTIKSRIAIALRKLHESLA